MSGIDPVQDAILRMKDAERILRLAKRHLLFSIFLLLVAIVLVFASCAPSHHHAPAPTAPAQPEPYTPTKTRLDLQLDLLGEPLDRRWPNEIAQVQDPYLGVALRIRVTVDDLSMWSYYVDPLPLAGAPYSIPARLAIYHQGHTGDARIYGAETIRALREAGWAVLVCSMPLRGENDLLPPVPPATTGSSNHDDLAGRAYPLRYFVWPVVESLTLAESFHTWDDVRMIGISGGGWTTMLVGALDERITSTYVVAGTWPKYLNDIHPGGRDLEQRATQPYLEDLYAYHQHGVFVYNDADPCCFSGEWYDGFLDPYLNVRAWIVENDQHSIAPVVLAEAVQ